ncbi:MAG TPA: hypothetical protein GXZ88_04675 [Firmicutes bacterium]|nr:hypothetical protein [Candidatus Fermentithermobacillaceae bacterium]
MNKIFGYIFKNKFRLAKGIIRHNLAGFLGLLLAGAFVLSQAIRIAAYLKPGRPLEDKYVLYIMAVFAAVSFYRAFLMKSPVILINAATLHHTFYTGYFKIIMMWQYLRLVFRSLAIAGISAYMISGRTVNLLFSTTCILLFAYLLLSELIAWISYHTSGSKTRLLGLMCLNALCLFAGGYSITAGPHAGGVSEGVFRELIKAYVANVAIALLAVELVVVLRHLKHKFQLDYSKYETYLRFIDETMAAQSQNNWAKMVQIAKEHSLKQEYKIMLHHFHPEKHNVLVYKNIIETARQGKAIWITLLALLVFAYTITMTTWLSWNSAEFPEFSKIIAVFLIATVYANLKEIWLRQANTVLQKSSLGLHIPFDTNKILLGYLPFPLIGYAALSAVLGLLFGLGITGMLALFASASLVYAADLLLLTKQFRVNKAVRLVLNALLFSGVYLVFA